MVGIGQRRPNAADQHRCTGGQFVSTSTSATPARRLLRRIAVAGALGLAIAGTAAVVDASPASASVSPAFAGPCHPYQDGWTGTGIYAVNGYGGWCDGTGPDSYRAVA